MGPRAYKNAFTVNSAIAGNEKNFRFGPILARFCMGILVTLSLSKKKGTYIFYSLILDECCAYVVVVVYKFSRSQIFLHNVAVGCPYELKYKRIGRKSL